MPSSIDLQARATHAQVQNDALIVALADGRVLSVPVAWFPRLAQATPQEQADWRLLGNGTGIHWEALDEDISVPGLLGLPD